MKQFQICLFLSKQNYFLKFDLTQDRTRGPTDKVSGCHPKVSGSIPAIASFGK